MNRPIEPRQHRDLLQERQIPVGRAFCLGIALGQVFVQFGLGFFLGFRLINVGRSQYAIEQFYHGFLLDVCQRIPTSL